MKYLIRGPLSRPLRPWMGCSRVARAQATFFAALQTYQRHPQSRQSYSTRQDAVDGRQRLSGLWAPSGGIAASDTDAHSMLIRAGFLRQAHSGIFHMLPLGKRVQQKLENLIDEYMSKLGSSKVDLSSISSEGLWEKSGRLNSVGSELFRFRDRKKAGYLLSPTHEEEITTLVSSSVKSYKELPVRLHQISRKYRDELRPRHGLLRSREFIMKDLYTFDEKISLALSTYHEVREMYSRLFDELKLPYLVAEADSGDIGGDLSHEFHFPTSKGEDHIISCTSCDYVANEEMAVSPGVKAVAAVEIDADVTGMMIPWYGISRDRSILVIVWYPSTQEAEASKTGPEVNFRAVKAIFPDLDSSVENPKEVFLAQHALAAGAHSQLGQSSNLGQMVNIIDGRISAGIIKSFESREYGKFFWGNKATESAMPPVITTISRDPKTNGLINILRFRTGDSCPRCEDGKVKVQEAIELGHTFYLGSRYSKPLEAEFMIPSETMQGQEADFELATEQPSGATRKAVMQMGCHGIGVSRMIGAVADTLADEKGLNWPRVMAPYEAVIIPARGNEDAAVDVYDALSSQSPVSSQQPLDLVLDDRKQSFPWKMQDADLVGYPVIVVVGKRWKDEKICEVQCRRLQKREEVALEALRGFVKSLLDQL